MRQKVGAEDDVRLTVRLPKELHAAIQEASQRNNRTFNGQLVHILTQMHTPTTPGVSYNVPQWPIKE